MASVLFVYSGSILTYKQPDPQTPSWGLKREVNLSLQLHSSSEFQGATEGFAGTPIQWNEPPSIAEKAEFINFKFASIQLIFLCSHIRQLTDKSLYWISYLLWPTKAKLTWKKKHEN